ncbi:MAG TPA: type I methionyl aminopeptidase [Chroococcales cyanobacterium]|jgi:methionyl aminopeptidase
MIIKTSEQQAHMRRAGRIVAAVLAKLKNNVQPGISTRELDRMAEEEIISLGGCPAFKGYQGYPHTLCVSINEEVVHGFPNRRRLKEGDIVSMDMGAIYQGLYGDAALTVGVGVISPEAARLLRVTKEALWKGIEMARAGNHLGDVSHAVQQHAESFGFSVVRDFVGHGIGEALHESPQVPNFGEKGEGPLLVPGMAIAIEPMINAGGYGVKILSNKWTVVTVDKSLSAHFEHTVLLTEGEAEVLTLQEGELG